MVAMDVDEPAVNAGAGAAEGGHQNELLEATLTATPLALSRAATYPPVAAVVGLWFVLTYGASAGVFAAGDRAHAVLGALAVPVLGTAGFFIVRDYVLVPMFLLPAALIGKLAPVRHIKAQQLEMVAAQLPGIVPEPVKLMTDDNVELDAVFLRNSDVPWGGPAASASKCIVWFNANGVLYEQNIAFAAKYASRVHAHALLFNYRGVSESRGWPSTSGALAVDGRAAIRHVLDSNGGREESVLLHGHSMGGGIIGKLAPEYPGCYKINDRSFWSIEGTAKFMMRPEVGLGKVMGLILFVYASTVVARATSLVGPEVLGEALNEALVGYNRILLVVPLGLVFGSSRHMEKLVEPVIGGMGWSVDAGTSAWAEANAMVVFHKRDVVINYEAASLHAWLARQGVSPASFELTGSESHHMTHMYPLDTIEREWDAFVAAVDAWWRPS